MSFEGFPSPPPRAAAPAPKPAATSKAPAPAATDTAPSPAAEDSVQKPKRKRADRPKSAAHAPGAALATDTLTAHLARLEELLTARLEHHDKQFAALHDKMAELYEMQLAVVEHHADTRTALLRMPRSFQPHDPSDALPAVVWPFRLDLFAGKLATAKLVANERYRVFCDKYGGNPGADSPFRFQDMVHEEKWGQLWKLMGAFEEEFGAVLDAPGALPQASPAAAVERPRLRVSEPERTPAALAVGDNGDAGQISPPYPDPAAMPTASIAGPSRVPGIALGGGGDGPESPSDSDSDDGALAVAARGGGSNAGSGNPMWEQWQATKAKQDEERAAAERKVRDLKKAAEAAAAQRREAHEANRKEAQRQMEQQRAQERAARDEGDGVDMLGPMNDMAVFEAGSWNS